MRKIQILVLTLLTSCSDQDRTKAYIGMCFRDTSAHQNLSKIISIDKSIGSVTIQWMKAGDRDLSNKKLTLSIPLNGRGYFQVDCPKTPDNIRKQ